jgi:hypothetical protein
MKKKPHSQQSPSVPTETVPISDWGPPGRRWIRFENDPEYWQALGQFIEYFASIEGLMFNFLAFYAKVEDPIAKAVFSGVRADAAMDYIRRIVAVNDPGDERRHELDNVFKQLKSISDARNDIVHYMSFVTSDLGRIVSNISRAHLTKNIKERPVSPAILKTMTTDLEKIGLHLVMHWVLPNASLAERARQEPILNNAWRYKPPQDQTMKVNKPVRRGPRHKR